MKKLLLSLSIIAALFSGCKKNDSATPSASAPPSPSYILPLKTGDVWHYRAIYFDENTNTPYDTEYVDITVDGDTTISGKTWYLVDENGSSDYLCNGNGGFYDSTSSEPAILAYPYPATVNSDIAVDQFGDSLKVVSINASIIVPNGTYSCYEYQAHSYGYILGNEYLSVGVGVVREDVFFQDGSGILAARLELVSHVVN